MHQLPGPHISKEKKRFYGHNAIAPEISPTGKTQGDDEKNMMRYEEKLTSSVISSAIIMSYLPPEIDDSITHRHYHLEGDVRSVAHHY